MSDCEERPSAQAIFTGIAIAGSLMLALPVSARPAYLIVASVPACTPTSYQPRLAAQETTAISVFPAAIVFAIGFAP